MSDLISFHGDPAIKAKYLKRLKAHHAADEIVKGRYWENGKGCAVGCTLHGNNHAAYESELGLPEWYGKLCDWLFENLPNREAKDFAVAHLESVPVGVSVQSIYHSFMAGVMELNLELLAGLPLCDSAAKDQVIAAVMKIRDLHVQQCQDYGAWSAAGESATATRPKTCGQKSTTWRRYCLSRGNSHDPLRSLQPAH